MAPRIRNISPDEFRRLFRSPDIQSPGLTVSDAVNLENALQSRRQADLEEERMLRQELLDFQRQQQELRQQQVQQQQIEGLGRAQSGVIQAGGQNIPAEQIQAPIPQGQELVAPEVPPTETTGQQIIGQTEQQLATELNPKEATAAVFAEQADTREQQAELFQDAIQFQNDLALEQEKSRLRIQEAAQKPNPDKAKKEAAQTSLTGVLDEMAEEYIKLREMGEVIDIEAPTIENIVTRAKTTAVGQAVAGAAGTEAQSRRNRINMSRPLLINFIRQASGMGARGIDSEKELEFYLQAATDPTVDVQTNLAALDRLDRAYGTGELKAQRKLDQGAFDRLQNKFNNLSKEEEDRLEAAHQARLAELRAQTGDPTIKLTGKNNGRPNKTTFNTVEEAEAANLPPGTRITIGGRPAIVE